MSRGGSVPLALEMLERSSVERRGGFGGLLEYQSLVSELFRYC
jgi:hypothetical protein